MRRTTADLVGILELLLPFGLRDGGAPALLIDLLCGALADDARDLAAAILIPPPHAHIFFGMHALDLVRAAAVRPELLLHRARAVINMDVGPLGAAL